MRPRPARHLHRSLAAAAAVVLVAIGVTGCGDDDDTSTGDGGGTTPPGVVVAEDFSLTDLTVAPGEEFTLDNQGEAPHTLTADDGSFDTGDVAAGSQSDPLTAPDEAGSYAFHCEIHPAMKATLTVEG